MTIDPKEVGARLKAVRAAMGPAVTRSDFGTRVELSLTDVHNYETGSVLLPVNLAQKILDAVPGLTFEWLYHGTCEGLPVYLRMLLCRQGAADYAFD